MSLRAFASWIAVLGMGVVGSACVGSTGAGDAGPAPPDAGPSDGGAPDAAPAADAGAFLAPCEAPAGSGTDHRDDVTADETWTAAASPHRIPTSLRLLATVRIEACARVELGPRVLLMVGVPGTPGILLAEGQRGVNREGLPARRPVTFAAASPDKPWGSLVVHAGSRAELRVVDVDDAAAPETDQNGGGAILVYGPSVAAGESVRSLTVVDTVIARSRGYGLSFVGRAGFGPGSEELVVRNGGRDAAAFPVRVPIGEAATLPTLRLEGNVRNEVELLQPVAGFAADTVPARGAPYVLAGRLRVAPAADGPPSTLTIEPGVTMRMATVAADSGIQLGTSAQRQGVLVAAGTAAAPIVFTSAASVPAAASWKNIYFAHSPASGNRLEHAVVEYAGAPSGAQGYGCGDAENDASVLILSGRPADAFIRNTTFRSGGGDTGIVLGWESDLDGPDFVSTNTFTDMPACRVSRWASVTGPRCPGSTAGSPVCL